MPPRACRPAADHRRSGAPRGWQAAARGVPAAVPAALMAALLAAALRAPPALAQGAPPADAGRPTRSMVSRSCAADHARFCPLSESGTSVDVACMRQHHVDLTISCRNLLARARPPGADGTPSEAAGGLASGGAPGARPRADLTP